MIFGENLKALRTARALSQKDLAEELGFSFQNISKWERSESLPDIETLLAIANFFGTTTDALLGHATEEKFSFLKIDSGEVTIYDGYPKQEEEIGGKLVFAVDGEGKIAMIGFQAWQRLFKQYTRENYDPQDVGSSMRYTYIYGSRNGKVTETKRIKIPEQGYVFVASNDTFAVKKIMTFIMPEEYHPYLDPDTHCGYFNSRNGRSLFSDILRKNELDYITVERVEDQLVFKKPIETVDPMSVNIEILAKIVRRELQKQHNKQIDELNRRIDELTDLVEENESRIEELEERA